MIIIIAYGVTLLWITVFISFLILCEKCHVNLLSFIKKDGIYFNFTKSRFFIHCHGDYLLKVVIALRCFLLWLTVYNYILSNHYYLEGGWKKLFHGKERPVKNEISYTLKLLTFKAIQRQSDLLVLNKKIQVIVMNFFNKDNRLLNLIKLF